MNNLLNLLEANEHSFARNLSVAEGTLSTCLPSAPGKSTSLCELEFALAQANRDAARVAPQLESVLPHFAKVIKRGQLAEVSTEVTRSIRNTLAKSLTHTMPNLS